MDEIVVTRLWMAGVVAMMVVFGVVAIVGVLRQRGKAASEETGP